MDQTNLNGSQILNDPLFDDANNAELGRSGGEHVRMLKFNDSNTYGVFADTSIAP